MRYRVTFTFSFHIQSNFVTRRVIAVKHMNLIRFWINIIFFYRASLGNGAVQAKNAYFNSDTYNPQTEEGMRITGNLGLREAMKAIEEGDDEHGVDLG